MNPVQPQATPAPIHDIVAPVPFFPYPIWMLVVAAIGVLAILGFLVWFFLLRPRPKKIVSATDRALASLGALRDRVDTEDPYPFSIEVSDVLRTFIRDTRGLNATTQTSIEFLQSVRQRRIFDPEAEASLERFLETADLIKFARVHATTDDCRELLESAETLVRQGATQPQPHLQEVAAS